MSELDKAKKLAEKLNKELGGVTTKGEIIKLLAEMWDYLDNSIKDDLIYFDSRFNLVINRVLVFAIDEMKDEIKEE